MDFSFPESADSQPVLKMLFNSIQFAVFLPVVFMLYWFVFNKKLSQQNLLLLASSYFFYGCWDWRFLFLLIFSTLLDYYTGLRMFQSSNTATRKFWFWTSIIINLGFLGVFKYYNFFAESFAMSLSALGLKVHPWTISVVLPVGISFYTFHGLSYVIDVYNRRIEAERNFIDYAVFVSFFPLLVAGPIERATHLLPQIKKRRVFEYSKAVDGLRQILWGLFKKVVIADTCAEFVNIVFGNIEGYGGPATAIAAVLFAIQIYCDFSGYSDIAIGTAKLFGIDLLKNFAFPYFSRDIAEFWRRWHISLSSWFRDYLYIPLGGNKGSQWVKVRNVFIVFIVSGFWHGANWTFIFWGFLNAMYFLPLLLSGSNRSNLDTVAQGKLLPSLKEFFQMVLTFFLTVIAWVFFRSPDIGHAWLFLKKTVSGVADWENYILTKWLFLSSLGLAFPFLLISFIMIEWMGRTKDYALAAVGFNWKRPARFALYYSILLIIFFLSGKNQQFIYFQF